MAGAGFVMRAKLFFAWYDFWIGFFYDRKSGALYICPLPCVVIKIWREERYISYKGTAMDGSGYESTAVRRRADKRADQA